MEQGPGTGEFVITPAGSRQEPYNDRCKNLMNHITADPATAFAFYASHSFVIMDCR